MLAHYDGDDDPVAGDDIIEAGWFEVDDLEQLPTLAFSADKFIIGKYRQMVKEQGDITFITLEGHYVCGV